jgi:NTP pyrophosphatase (non-canonical NTP hydrolase)
MNKLERIELYDKATKKWGMQAQIDQMIEETAELIVALNKYKRNKYYLEKTDEQKMYDNLFVELADVSICLEQMVNYFGEDKLEQAKQKQLQKFKTHLLK